MKTLRSFPLIAQMLMLVGIMLLAWVAATVLTMLLPALGIDIQSRQSRLALQGISQLLVFLLPALLFVRFFHPGERYLPYPCRGPQWLHIGIGILLLLTLTPSIEVIGLWNDGWHFGGRWSAVESALRHITEQAEALTQQMLLMPHWTELIWVLLVVALIPAVCEEMLFRGILQQSLFRRWGNIHVSIWITALIFSIFHGDLFAFMPRLVLGGLLGYLFAYSGSLTVNTAVHFLNNAIIVVHYYLYQHDVLHYSPDDPIGFALPTVLCSVAAAGYLFWELTKTRRT